MINVYKNISVSKLKINSEFDYSSREKVITLNNSGINISVRDLNIVRELSQLDPIKSLKEVNYKLSDTLNINSSDRVKWKYLIGEKSCRRYTQALLQDINFSKSILTTYHTDVLKVRKKLYRDLVEIVDDSGKVLERPVYDHSGVSGRTSIKSGFNFLTSSKEFRKSCKSQTENNFLVSIDFKACEPNLYLRAIGKNIKNSDVYNHLMKELDIRVEGREKLKRGILSVLYGASDDTASRILGGDKTTLNKIKEFFEIEKWARELQKEFDEKKCIFNMYGRPIFSDKSILNKWIQSSAVDFCSLAFLNLVEEHDLKVAYLVHDDMVIDCEPSVFEKIKELKQIKEPRSNISLPVEVTLLSA